MIMKKVAYLKGLAEGFGIDGKKDNLERIVVEILDCLSEIGDEIEFLNSDFQSLEDYVEMIDDDLADLESFLEEDDCFDFDDELDDLDWDEEEFEDYYDESEGEEN